MKWNETVSIVRIRIRDFGALMFRLDTMRKISKEFSHDPIHFFESDRNFNFLETARNKKAAFRNVTPFINHTRKKLARLAQVKRRARGAMIRKTKRNKKTRGWKIKTWPERKLLRASSHRDLSSLIFIFPFRVLLLLPLPSEVWLWHAGRALFPK